MENLLDYGALGLCLFLFACAIIYVYKDNQKYRDKQDSRTDAILKMYDSSIKSLEKKLDKLCDTVTELIEKMGVK